jgi:hypothetical protein
VTLGAQAIVMENALIRGRASHPAEIGRHVVVGPHAHLTHEAAGRPLDFPGTAFGLPRDTPDLPVAATRRYAELFGRHRGDRVLPE